jgi:hypothetical protein
MADSHTTPDIVTELLVDGFGRIREGVPEVVEGLGPEELLWRPDADANHIAWLVWHLARQQDEQMAHLGHTTSAWRSGDWAGRFGLPYPASAHGYGMTSEEVGAFPLPDASVLVDYHAAVHDLTLEVLHGLGASDYRTVIDRNWDPPVTAAARIVSVLDDSAKHLGQAEYVRGMVTRRR